MSSVPAQRSLSPGETLRVVKGFGASASENVNSDFPVRISVSLMVPSRLHEYRVLLSAENSVLVILFLWGLNLWLGVRDDLSIIEIVESDRTEAMRSVLEQATGLHVSSPFVILVESDWR